MPIARVTVNDMINAPRAEENQASRSICSANDPGRGVDFIARALGPTTLIAIRPDDGPAGGFYLDPDNVADAAAWAERLSADGCNIYYSSNQPAPGTNKKPLKSDIQFIRCWHADVDAKDGRTLEQALVDIGKMPLPPSFIVATGGGYQPIWMLSEPVQATTITIDRAERAGMRLAKLLGGDAVQNVDRILRVPFTVNYPNAKKRAAGRKPCLSGIVGSVS
jgi:hypothetical protein